MVIPRLEWDETLGDIGSGSVSAPGKDFEGFVDPQQSPVRAGSQTHKRKKEGKHKRRRKHKHKRYSSASDSSADKSPPRRGIEGSKQPRVEPSAVLFDQFQAFGQKLQANQLPTARGTPYPLELTTPQEAFERAVNSEPTPVVSVGISEAGHPLWWPKKILYRPHGT